MGLNFEIGRRSKDIFWDLERVLRFKILRFGGMLTR